MDFLQMVNQFIPLDAVWIAGVALVGVVLVLSVLGCILRHQLVPHWLIWLYFTFAVIIVWAQDAVTLDNVLAYMEFPILVVLVCYILRCLFRRKPRYVYVPAAVYERRIAPKLARDKSETDNKTVKEKKVTKMVKTTVTEKAPHEIETTVTETQSVVDALPTVEPMQPKTYEPVREPEVITTPLIENLPDVPATAARPTPTARPSTTTTTVRPLGTTNTINSTNTMASTATRQYGATSTASNNTVRPTGNMGATTAYAPRPTMVTTTTVTRPVTTVNTTTTTTTTTSRVNNTVNNTVNSSSSLHTAGSTNTSTATNTKSTQDIMDAIARLRASMNNKK